MPDSRFLAAALGAALACGTVSTEAPGRAPFDSAAPSAPAAPSSTPAQASPSTARGWVRLGQPPPGHWSALSAFNDRLFLSSSSALASAPLGPDGVVGAWTTLGGPPSASIAWQTAALATSSADGRTAWIYSTGGGFGMQPSAAATFAAQLERDGTLGPWLAAPAMKYARQSHCAVRAGDHLFVLGGLWWSGGSYTGYGVELPAVESARIREDGLLDAWRTSAFLPVSRCNAAAAGLRNLYFVSGRELLVGHVDERGAFDRGWLRAAAQPPVALPESIAAVFASGRLVLLSAAQEEGSGAVLPRTLIGTIDATGDVVSWTTSPADASPDWRPGLLAAATGSAVYLVSGTQTEMPDLFRAVLDPATGHFGPFVSPVGPQPPGQPLRVLAEPGPQQMVVRWSPPLSDGGGPLLGYTLRVPGGPSVSVGPAETSAILGGLSDGTPVAAQVVAINAAGAGPISLGPSVVPWPTPAFRPAATGLGDGKGTLAAAVFGRAIFTVDEQGWSIAPFDESGVPWGVVDPGPWRRSVSPRRGSRFSSVSVPVDEGGGCLYLIGGQSPEWPFPTQGSTQVRCFRDDGFVGGIPPSAASTQSMLAPTRKDHASVVVRGFVYAVGGVHADAAATPGTPLADVSFAPLNADRSLGTWTATTPLPAPCPNPTLAADDGHLYLVAPPFAPASTLVADVALDGRLSAWRSASATLSLPRGPATALRSAGNLYLLGGTEAGKPNVSIGRLDSARGDVVAWEQDSRDSYAGIDGFRPPATTDGLHLFVGRQSARIDPVSGHLLTVSVTDRRGE